MPIYGLTITQRSISSRALIYKALNARSISRLFPNRSYSFASTMSISKQTEVEKSPTTKDMATSPYYNQGITLSEASRAKLGLRGYLPSAVESLEKQKERALIMLRSKKTSLDKYIFLAHLRNTNTHLFYKLTCDELEEIAPLIYTPTVGEACLNYSNIYPFLAPPGSSDGLYLTLNDLPNIEEIIRNYRPITGQSGGFSPEIAVISDGSRILGLGDLGVNGMGIPIGKLQLYVAGAGIDPRKTLPILLDLGTNNKKYLEDPLYVGLKQTRPDEDTFYSAVDKVLAGLHTVYPDLLIQFEDWSSEHAFGLLNKYKNKILTFNDDIQGTGAVILSGLMNAIRKVESESKVAPKDHRIVFYGAGSAAVGVATQIQEYFQTEYNMTEDEAKKVFWLVDSKGMITQDRGDKLANHKVYYARDDNNGKQFKELTDIVDYVKPTVLIGLSSSTGAFNSKVLSRLAELNKQPIVFPLSNPASQAECTFEQAMESTNNSVVFASGTAFPPYTDPKTGEIHVPGQGNNMYIFPGLGLGAVLAHPKLISNSMIYSAAKALANSLTPEERGQGWLYPSLKRIRAVSADVAAAVCETACQENLARSQIITNLKTHDEIVKHVTANMWSPTQDTAADTRQDVYQEANS
ncbi:hypothetical protein PHYBLDRAFT_60321 [Phycomyces blakesleeanus NRRL 1555(-)]|uniref:Malic enzyme n=2 Tax=Phycomyces blakesleeanus TaxID=4837 RepID=A0A167LAQ6_PHYB8|nr:hypothetical protein PHYBLDRAFT_60321 [Phycomyces blakesleeanus NRRL 1555(-)]OAD69999.1 hypothetical protein PHYBLDRAFT_60321 [Phycomyces blakesleeanus NRRL 1555(-)]|eukprot:XP_018288039.1 hypothetical protein PHYBLDRAFT_60321 [Phycomyces blakesleeanus NRRL 1555(-)]